MTAAKHITSPDVTDSAKTLGEHIRRIRLSQNRTQLSVAEQAGMTVRTYGHFEKTGECRTLKFIEILSALGCARTFFDAFLRLNATSSAEALGLQKKRRRARTEKAVTA